MTLNIKNCLSEFNLSLKKIEMETVQMIKGAKIVLILYATKKLENY